MYLETERLILREAMPEDVDEYAAIRNSQFVQQFNVFTDRSREQILKDFTDGSGEGDALIMQHKESNAVVGAIFIGEDSIRYGVASKELSYFLGEAYSCKGYMKEALSAVIDYLFSEEKLECVAARSFAPNTASRKLLESLGFHQDGVIPRCVCGYQNRIFDDTLYSLFAK